MHKILIEVKNKTLIFSLYTSREKVDNLNDTNIVNTEKMIFSDTYINNNLNLIRSFVSLVIVKNNVEKVVIKINAIFPLVYRIIKNISNIKTISLLEDKIVSYAIFEYLLDSEYIENVECYSMPSYMLDKLASDKNMNIDSRCEVLFLSKFMEKNNFNTYSDIYYKKSIDIDCNMDKVDKEDIDSFFRLNTRVKVINVYNVNEKSIDFIFDLIRAYNVRNIKLILNQENMDKNIIDLTDKILHIDKKLIKSNNIKLKINYTKEYRDKNTLKQVNLSFLRLILVLFIVLAIAAIVVFSIKYEGDTDDINDEMNDLDEIIDLNEIDRFIQEEEKIMMEDEEEPVVEENNTTNTSENTNNNNSSNSNTNTTNNINDPYSRKFDQVFDDLLKINDETVGWLKVNNTKITYPVTKHSDNDYYLNYSYYKKKNSHGWIFMDYRNSIDTLDKNTIIYGHRNSKGLMFGTLKNVLEKSWYTNKDNQIITFNTVNQNMKWQIFSIYTLKNTNDYLITNFTNDTTFTNFIKKIKGRSIYDFGVEVGVDDNILTLSTCYNNAEYRLVVHAKLIK